MIASALVGFLVLIGAVAIGGLEYVMSPSQRRFPCVNKVTIWVLRIYATSLFAVAVDRLNHVRLGDPLPATLWQFNGALWLCLAHVVLFASILRARLPEGVWPYLQIRYERAKAASKPGGVVGATLAKAAAEPRNPPEPGLYQPPTGWTGVLTALLHRP